MANIEWLGNVLAVDSDWRSLGLAAALAALVGITWHLSRVRAERRWLAALDAAYAKLEQTKMTHSRRNSHARPQS